MITVRLLWNAIWRATLWGTLAGVVLGVIYGALFGTLTAILITGLDSNGSVANVSLIGAISGGTIGAGAGLGLGLVGGLILAIWTRLAFFPLTDARHYRAVVAIASALFGAGGLFLLVVSPAIGMMTGGERTYADAVIVIFATVVPALLAGLCAVVISREIARWYERETLKGANKNA